MKLLKFGIRFWITITSVLSFLVGLGHAGARTQTQSDEFSINKYLCATADPGAASASF